MIQLYCSWAYPQKTGYPATQLAVHTCLMPLYPQEQGDETGLDAYQLMSG